MNMKNNLFGGLERDQLVALEKQTAIPIPLWDRIRVGDMWLPCASMLTVVSSYETILEVVAGVIPLRQKDGSYKTQYYHWVGKEAVVEAAKGGCPLAHLNRSHLHAARGRYASASKKILETPHLPREIGGMQVEFRLLRAFRLPQLPTHNVGVEKWQMFRIDDAVTESLHGKTRIQIPKALTLEYELQCPPPFEMAEQAGFNTTLLRDLGVFLRRPEHVPQSTATVLKYKLWKAAELGAFHEMFALAEQERREAMTPPPTSVGIGDMLLAHGADYSRRDQSRAGGHKPPVEAAARSVTVPAPAHSPKNIRLTPPCGW